VISFSTFLYFTLSNSLHRDVDNKLRSLAELVSSESSVSPFEIWLRKYWPSPWNLHEPEADRKIHSSLRRIGKHRSEIWKIWKMSSSPSVWAPWKCLQRPDHLWNESIYCKYALRIITFPVVENNHVTKIVQIASSLEEVEDVLNTLFIILIITVL